ncbi:hypothetical protein M885DRAFT_30590 [Pelagophyceae sp. CCMP2097]|nr:hypothetical protein M885DRAFT_30590 [Pelagophyceae sp. CCMP2097]
MPRAAAPATSSLRPAEIEVIIESRNTLLNRYRHADRVPTPVALLQDDDVLHAGQAIEVRRARRDSAVWDASCHSTSRPLYTAIPGSSGIDGPSMTVPLDCPRGGPEGASPSLSKRLPPDGPSRRSNSTVPHHGPSTMYTVPRDDP